MAPPLKPTVYTGTFIHTPTLGALEVLRNAAVAVDEHGVIVSIIKDVSMQDLEEKFGAKGKGEGDGKWWEVCDLAGKGEGAKWWCPGFVGE